MYRGNLGAMAAFPQRLEAALASEAVTARVELGPFPKPLKRSFSVVLCDGLDGQVPVGVEDFEAALLFFQIGGLIGPELFLD